VLKLIGLETTLTRLALMDKKVRTKVIRRAVRRGAEPLRDEARSKCPANTGTLAKSIRITTSAKPSKGTARARVQTGQGYFKGETFYGAFVEFGHFIGSRAKGAARQFCAARPFLRPAHDAKKEEAVRIVTEDIKAGIEEGVR
jgi:HK97 gp10 family phage protein